jgi:hypothetical protein
MLKVRLSKFDVTIRSEMAVMICGGSRAEAQFRGA